MNSLCFFYHFSVFPFVYLVVFTWNLCPTHVFLSFLFYSLMSVMVLFISYELFQIYKHLFPNAFSPFCFSTALPNRDPPFCFSKAWLVNKEGRDVESLKQSVEYKMEFSLKLIGWASMLVIMQTDFIR